MHGSPHQGGYDVPIRQFEEMEGWAGVRLDLLTYQSRVPDGREHRHVRDDAVALQEARLLGRRIGCEGLSLVQ